MTTKPTGALKALGANLWPPGDPHLRFRLCVIFAMSLASSSLAAIAPLFLRALVASISHPMRAAIPIGLALAYPAARFVGLATIQARVMLTALVMEGAKARFAVSAFRHILSLPRSFQLDRSTGALARVLDRGVAGLETSIRSTHIVVFQVLLEAALVSVVLSRVISLTFGLIVLAVMAGYATVAIVFTRRQTTWRRKRNALDNTASTIALEGLINWDTVQACGGVGYEVDRYAAAKRALADVSVRVQAAVSSMFIGWQALEALALGSILTLAAHDVIAGRMSIAELVLVQVYMAQVFANMTGLGVVYNDARQGFADLEALQAILDQEPDAPDDDLATPLDIDAGHLVFDRVGFAYRPERPALADVAFEVPPGRTVALVGPSGAGKTTIGHLALRFHRPQVGAILIDGQDIAAVSAESLHAAVGVVSQDTQLFNDTIGYNIRYGRPGASRADVEDAARRAALADFIERLPEGYDTHIGERGLKLSGGERQRIAIARLILRRPRIFIFDEATASVDSLTERDVQRSLREVSAGATTLVIAHRLSTITDADEILVIDAGRIAERGDHAALLRHGGLYARLWEQQARSL